MYSFTARDMDEGSPTRVPCDVPGGLRCGTDEQVHECVGKLAGAHGELFRKWVADAKYKAALATGERPAPQYWFLLSAQLHVADYTMMRRQAWWVRYHDACEGGLGWRTSISGDLLGDKGVGCFAGLPTSEEGKFLLTDRALAMMDAHEDMAWLTRLRIAKDGLMRRADQAAQERLGRVKVMEQEALELSQQNRFDAARAQVREAVALVRNSTAGR